MKELTDLFGLLAGATAILAIVLAGFNDWPLGPSYAVAAVAYTLFLIFGGLPSAMQEGDKWYENFFTVVGPYLLFPLMYLGAKLTASIVRALL